MMAPIEGSDALVGTSAIAGRSARSPVPDLTLFVLGSISFIARVVAWDKLPSGASPSVVALDWINAWYTAPLTRGVILSAVLFCLSPRSTGSPGFCSSWLPAVRCRAPSRWLRRSAWVMTESARVKGSREVRMGSFPLWQLFGCRGGDTNEDRHGSREGPGVPVLDRRGLDRGGVSGILGPRVPTR